MSKMNLLKLLTLVLLGTTFGYAQASRTWVSGVGDDANPCSRTAPCKTFAGAISKTAPGGEIDALDPGGFGAVTITKAITIDGGGGQVASVLVAGTNGIVVQANSSTDVVILRNLRINGIGSGINGIRWLSGKALHIDHCWIFGFTNNGIDIAKSDGGKAYIDDTTSENNGSMGLNSVNSTSTVSVFVNRSNFENNASFGILAGSFSSVSVRESQASGNPFGFVSQANAGTSELDLANSTAANSSMGGLFAGGGTAPSTLRITGVSLFNNAAGMTVAANGNINSWGNNFNGGSGAPSGTTLQQ